jgi:hypothetical protein
MALPGASSVVVRRAGAGSLFDIAAAGRAAILIPFPHATGDHQLHNARYFTERDAAELMPDSEVGADALQGPRRRHVERRFAPGTAGERIGALATPGAAAEVADRLLGRRRGGTESMKTHMIGIGGAGMSGIAEVLKSRGDDVTGSDLKESPTPGGFVTPASRSL